MQIFFAFLVFGLALCVLIDAKKIGVKKGQLTGLANIGPWSWFFGCWLLWIIFFPLYLSKRQQFININSKPVDSTVPTTPPQKGLGFGAWFFICLAGTIIISIIGTSFEKEKSPSALDAGKVNQVEVQATKKAAIKDTVKSVVINPKQKSVNPNITKAKIWYEKGNDCFQNDNYEDAIEYFSKALELNPNDGGSFFGKTLSYIQVNRCNDAIDECNKWIERPKINDKERGVAYYLMATAYAKLGDAYEEKLNMRISASYGLDMAQNWCNKRGIRW